MDDKNFKALIKLLDDEDPSVAEHVWGELINMGQNAVERLEAEWETQQDPTIQRKLEEVIHRITMKDVSKELLEWRKEGGKDLLKGWFLITRFQYPELTYSHYKNEINRFINKAWLQINPKMSPHQKLRVVNHLVFNMEHFGPNANQPGNPHNSYLNHLLDTRKGNAISLSLLYLIICEKLDFPVKGVILPGYFVLIFNDGKTEFYIDPYNGGGFFNRNNLSNFLQELNVEEKPSYYKPTSNIYIILNLIQTLKRDYQNADKPNKVRDLDRLLEEIEINFE